MTLLDLIPAISIHLHRHELEDLLHSDAAKGLRFVECDVFDVSRDHYVSANEIPPRIPSVAILTLFTFLSVFFIYAI